MGTRQSSRDDVRFIVIGIGGCEDFEARVKFCTMLLTKKNT